MNFLSPALRECGWVSFSQFTYLNDDDGKEREKLKNLRWTVKLENWKKLNESWEWKRALGSVRCSNLQSETCSRQVSGNCPTSVVVDTRHTQCEHKRRLKSFIFASFKKIFVENFVFFFSRRDFHRFISPFPFWNCFIVMTRRKLNFVRMCGYEKKALECVLWDEKRKKRRKMNENKFLYNQREFFDRCLPPSSAGEHTSVWAERWKIFLKIVRRNGTHRAAFDEQKKWNEIELKRNLFLARRICCDQRINLLRESR